MLIQCPSPKLSPFYVIIASLLCVTAPCGFFLCVPVCLGMLHKKFRCFQTKTVCLVGFVRDSVYEQPCTRSEAIMDTKINSLSHFSMNNKRVATELWTAGWFHLKNMRKHLHLLECSLRHIWYIQRARDRTSTTSSPWWRPWPGGWIWSSRTVETSTSSSQ